MSTEVNDLAQDSTGVRIEALREVPPFAALPMYSGSPWRWQF